MNAPDVIALEMDVEALGRHLEAHVEGFAGPFSLEQFAGGQSNPTFRISASSGEYVLRRRPLGNLAATAHAVDREYRVLKAIAGQGVPVPRVYHYCADSAVIGSAFYVMEFVPGRVVSDPLLPGMSPAERSAIYDSMNDALSRLHGVDWNAAGLADYGRPANYMARQIARLAGQGDTGPGAGLPAMQRLKEWLTSHLPTEDRATITHGDFRLGNLILHPREPRVVAILDWELSTLGPPLTDLAYDCMSYHLPVGHRIAPGVVGADIGALGIPTEEQYVEAYCRRTGRAGVPDWTFYVAFSLYRVAAIQFGVHARFLAGNAVSTLAASFGESARMVAERGWELVSRV